MQGEVNSRVESISLAANVDQRIALASVRIGDVLIRGVAIWRSRHGRLRVYFPRYWAGVNQGEAIELPDELRADIEADIIAAYKAAKTRTKDTGGHDAV